MTTLESAGAAILGAPIALAIIFVVVVRAKKRKNSQE
jgi:hypothetical protein